MKVILSNKIVSSVVDVAKVPSKGEKLVFNKDFQEIKASDTMNFDDADLSTVVVREVSLLVNAKGGPVAQIIYVIAPTEGGRRGRAAATWPNEVNWDQTNEEIHQSLQAVGTEISVARIAQVRNKLTGTNTRLQKREALDALAKEGKFDTGDLDALAKEHGCSKASIIMAKKRNERPFEAKQKLSDKLFPLINWQLPNRDIATIWGRPAPEVSSWRAKHELMASVWDARNRSLIENEDYLAAIATEKRRAGELAETEGINV